MEVGTGVTVGEVATAVSCAVSAVTVCCKVTAASFVGAGICGWADEGDGSAALAAGAPTVATTRPPVEDGSLPQPAMSSETSVAIRESRFMKALSPIVPAAT